MISVNSSTLKKDLLTQLQSESDSHGDLYIELVSLPSYLNTPVAFTIFNYQINSYPRKIIWIANNDTIFSLLQNVEANIITQKDYSEIAPQLANSDVIEEDSEQNHTKNQSNHTVLSTQIQSKNDDQKDSNSSNAQKHHPEHSHPQFEGTQFDSSTLFVSNPIIDSIDTITSPSIPSPSIISTNSQKIKKQNFDQWLERLSATKEALDSLKTNSKDFSKPNDSANDNPIVARPSSHHLDTYTPPQPQRTFSKKFVVFATISVVFLILGAISLFPTTAYTITLKAETEERSVELEIPTEEFARRNSRIEATAEGVSSGQQSLPTERAIGLVSLINPGNKEVTLDNGKFRLMYNNNEYEAVVNSTLTSTFKIPARNNLNGPAIEFTIQSRNTGAEYNLPESTQLEIVNFLGQKVCLTCYAVTISPIVNSQISGEKIITEADHSLLIGTIESDIAKKRISEVENIQEKDVFTHPSWYKNTGSDYTFSQPTGARAVSFSLKAVVTTELYYLPQSVVEQKIRQNNDQIQEFKNIALLETSGGFDQSVIKVKMFYSFTKKSTISSDTLKQSIKEANCKSDLVSLQQQHPSIDYVDCRNQGMQIPGIPPRVDLKIVNE